MKTFGQALDDHLFRGSEHTCPRCGEVWYDVDRGCGCEEEDDALAHEEPPGTGDGK